MSSQQTLKFLVDESTGKKVHSFLLQNNFDAKYVTEIMRSAPDADVLAFAERENRILITNDKDFGELVFRLKQPSSGVIFLRLKKDSAQNRIKYVSYLINNFSDNLQNHFITIKEGTTRVRKL